MTLPEVLSVAERNPEGSLRVPFGDYEGCTLEELAPRGDVVVLLWILGKANLRADRPQVYLEAWRRLIEYGSAGGPPPEIWIDGRGRPQFLASRNRPSSDGSVALYRPPDCALVRAMRPGQAVRKRELVAGVAASLPPPAPGRRDRRRDQVRLAIERLRKRSVLYVTRDLVTRTHVAVRTPAADEHQDAGLDLV